MSDATYPLFSIFAFLGFILSLIPLPWHLQAWNSGTCYFMIWTSLSCLNQFVNSVVWAGNARNPAPWWCEISIRILMGASVGIPASSFCIVRRLYTIASAQTVTVTPAEKRRAVLLDSLICVLFPVVYIGFQYIVQGHRFNIYEDIGCFPALYNTLLTYFISLMWPLLIGLASATYCCLALWEFNKRRIQFNHFLASNGSLTLSRYVRLMALAMVEMICTTPLSVFVIYLNATATPVGPWVSWSDTHFDYSRIEQIPALFWRSNHQLVISMELTRWLSPFCALVFFSFFGFAQEAKKNYRLAYLAIAKRVKFLPRPDLKLPMKCPPFSHGHLPLKNNSIPLSPISPTKFVEKTPYSASYGSTFSTDDRSMSDFSSKYDTKVPITPSTASPITPVVNTDSPIYIIGPAHERMADDLHDRTFDLSFSVTLPHGSDSRRFTM